MASTGVLHELPGLAAGLPAPPESLDPVLDAAARCFARHGVRRTSVPDIARELRVDRTTVYRQAGTVDRVVRLLMARELHRLLEVLPDSVVDLQGPEVIVDLVATVVAFGRNHPVLAKVLADEPELIGPFLVTDAPAMLDQVASLIAPVLDAAMASGELARRDPLALAQLLVRLCMSNLLAPPPGDLRIVLAELLVPALTPARPSLPGPTPPGPGPAEATEPEPTGPRPTGTGPTGPARAPAPDPDPPTER